MMITFTGPAELLGLASPHERDGATGPIVDVPGPAGDVRMSNVESSELGDRGNQDLIGQPGLPGHDGLPEKQGDTGVCGQPGDTNQPRLSDTLDTEGEGGLRNASYTELHGLFGNLGTGNVGQPCLIAIPGDIGLSEFGGLLGLSGISIPVGATVLLVNTGSCGETDPPENTTDAGQRDQLDAPGPASSQEPGATEITEVTGNTTDASQRDQRDAPGPAVEQRDPSVSQI